MRRLRILVLMHPDCMPPDSSEGYSAQEINKWKTESDVVSTLRAAGHDVRVASAKAVKSSVLDTWQVEVTLNSADRTRFAALTGSIAPASAPRNEIAIVIDGKLWGMPYVRTSITGGRLEIAGPYAGDLTSAAVHDLAHRLDPGE